MQTKQAGALKGGEFGQVHVNRFERVKFFLRDAVHAVGRYFV
eukprot:gene6456-4406_t